MLLTLVDGAVANLVQAVVTKSVLLDPCHLPGEQSRALLRGDERAPWESRAGTSQPRSS